MGIHNRGGLPVPVSPVRNSGLQRTETDAHSAKVQPLVNLKGCVQPVPLGHDFLYLIRYDGIEAATERIKFHQLQILVPGYKVGCLIKAVMI